MVLSVDDVSLYMIASVMDNRSDATAIVRTVIVRLFAPTSPKINDIRINNSGMF